MEEREGVFWCVWMWVRESVWVCVHVCVREIERGCVHECVSVKLLWCPQPIWWSFSNLEKLNFYHLFLDRPIGGSGIFSTPCTLHHFRPKCSSDKSSCAIWCSVASGVMACCLEDSFIIGLTEITKLCLLRFFHPMLHTLAWIILFKNSNAASSCVWAVKRSKSKKYCIDKKAQ